MNREELIEAVNGLKQASTHRKRDKLSGILYVLKLKIDTGKDEPSYAIRIANTNQLFDALETEV